MSQQKAHLTEDWLKGFPDTDLGDAVRLMLATWQRLRRDFPGACDPNLSEPEITATFCDHLFPDGEKAGLNGTFLYEVRRAKTHPETGKRIQPIRTDIEYRDTAITLPSGRRLAVIFEFKKLKNNDTSRTGYVGKKGMQRFLTGDYKDHAEYVAFMVGLVHDEAQAAIAAIEARLKRAGTRDLLHIRPDDSGRHVLKPSAWFPESVHFDTVHSRTTQINAAEHSKFSDLVLCHVFLEH